MEESHTEDNRNYFLYVQYGICYLFGTRIELYKIVMSLKKNPAILTLDQKYGVLSLFLE